MCPPSPPPRRSSRDQSRWIIGGGNATPPSWVGGFICWPLWLVKRESRNNACSLFSLHPAHLLYPHLLRCRLFQGGWGWPSHEKKKNLLAIPVHLKQLSPTVDMEPPQRKLPFLVLLLHLLSASCVSNPKTTGTWKKKKATSMWGYFLLRRCKLDVTWRIFNSFIFHTFFSSLLVCHLGCRAAEVHGFVRERHSAKHQREPAMCPRPEHQRLHGQNQGRMSREKE